MMAMKKVCGFLFCLLLFNFSHGAVYLIPRLSNPPAIDGAISQAEWQGSTAIFLTSDAGQQPANDTAVNIGYDDHFLYLAFICQEKNIAEIVTAYQNQEEHDNRIWQDDSVDLSIKPFGDDRGYKIIVNSAGIVYDALNGNTSWESHVERKTKITDKAWQVEMKIPFEQFGFTPKGGEIWKINLARTKQKGPQNSTLSGKKGSFMSDLQDFHFAGGGDFILTAVNRQNNQETTGYFKKPGSYQIQIETFIGNSGKIQFNKMIAVAETDLEYHFPWKAAKNYERIRLQVGNAYQNDFSLPAIRNATMRVWISEKPLYQELIAATPPPMPSFNWFHEKEGGIITNQALQYGFAFDRNIVYKDIASTNNLIYVGYHELEQELLGRHRKQFNMWLIVHPDHRRANIPSVSRRGRKLLCDPVARATFLEQVEDLCARREEINLGAITIGDERAETEIALLVAFLQEKLDYPLIPAIDEAIKRDYGGGKWGIPLSLNDPTPGRWIATHHYLSVQLASLLAQTYQIIKSKAPDVPLVTDDPVDGATSQDLAMWRGNFDIVTGQLYPRRNQDLADFAFNTKKIKDLSGAKIIQPLPHIEHYAGNFSLPEVRAMLSQAVIGGADGWHFYLSDTIGRRSGKGHLITEYFGAPDRYKLIYNIAAATPRLRYPEADCAFFISQDTSWQSNRYRPAADMAAFTMLGPRAGLWFDIINETSMELIDLKKYKAVFISDAKYERSKAISTLTSYVRQGGVLVIFDPNAFTRNQLDEDTSDQAAQLFGSKINTRKGDMSFNFAGNTYSMPQAGNSLELLGNAEAVATYGNKSPVVSCRKLGSGKLFRFAFNPTSENFLKSKQWQKFVRDFAVSLQLRVNQPIWHFSFPESFEPEPNPPKGICLTGNSIYWTLFRPDGAANRHQAGSYQWSRQPDLIADLASDSIPFKSGKLTNRRNAFSAGNVDKGHGSINDWVVRFRRNEPIAVTFDLNAIGNVSRIQLYYQGDEPQLAIDCSKNKQSWQENVNYTTTHFPGAVQKLIVHLQQPNTARYVRINFLPKPQEAKPLTLAEIDIWED